MPVDWSTLHKVLRDETRKKIILNLQSAGLITYTDLMNRLEITNTGKLNYHLKMLNDLIAKNDQGAYVLTERGKAAAELLDKSPEPIARNRGLKAFDSLIIGLVGLLLAAVPIFLGAFTPSMQPIVLFLYLLLLPSFVMWWMTARRTNSHDLFDLMKAPIITATLTYLLILLAFLLPRLLASPPSLLTNTTTTTTTTTQTIYMTSIVFYLLSPIIPLLGVLLIEGVYRFSNR